MSRRFVTVPAVLLAFAIVASGFPFFFLLALFIDLARLSRTFSTTRLTLFALAFLATETLGLTLLFFTFVTTRAQTRPRAVRTFAIQRLYTAFHLAAVTRIFSLRFEIIDGHLAAPGPVLVLCRHASLVDVLIPGGFVANVHHLELRYVLKKELLLEPCLDIAGHWIPNYFVDRGGADTQRELEAIRALKAGLGPTEGVLLYPEGTRFSRRRRDAVISKLEGDEKKRAEALLHLLPIRPGGALTLLDAAPSCDVVFIGHHGLEGLGRLKDIWRGTLVRKTVTVRFWREAATSVPAGQDERIAWLHHKWLRVDSWLEEFPT
ncbi:MAG: 1-acyl-sn-glycerol-3-phosphate acyltransferase [Myxococcaceae bacterium]